MNKAALVLGHATLLVLLVTVSLPLSAQSFDGLWQSDGYGLFIEVQGPTMTVFQTTSISCVQWWSARRSDNGRTTAEEVFHRGDADVRLTPGPLPNTLLMKEGASISSISLARVSVKPRTCSATLQNTPLNNYEVFWETYAEQFALFPVYRMDWASVDRKYRPRVTAKTSAQELFDTLRAMILPFHNAHTNINAASIGRQYVGYRRVSEIGRRLQSTSSLSVEEILELFKEEAQKSKAIVESRYSDGPLRSYANGKIDFGTLRHSIGYLRFTEFEDYSKEGNVGADAASLETALDEIFTAAERLKGLIIDVRVNVGGADPLALAVASRLTSARYIAYSKVARANANINSPLHFTTPQPAWIEVSTRPGFRGPIVLLIGPDTISGGETFAMALMGRVPRVIFVGENTQGVFSDVWGRKLPNGWTFGVPTELYLTPSGDSFDAKGVPPDIRVPVFPQSDLKAGRDGALKRALSVLLARGGVNADRNTGTKKIDLTSVNRR